MTQPYRYLSLFILPLVFLFSSTEKSYGQCPVFPSYSYANTCLSHFEVGFTNTSSAPTSQIASYFWDFGDGTNSTSTDPTHIFPGAGIYTVYLYVYDTSGCYDSIFQNVAASQLPGAAFGTTVIGCRLVNFNNTSSYGGVSPSWSWNFDDPASGANNTSNLQSPQHSFTAAGTYNVMLAIADNYGCTDTVWQNITFDPIVPDFTWDLNCAESPIQFTDLSSSTGDPITLWYWDFGDGNSKLQQHPIHTYASGGVYFVTLTITTATGCSESIVQMLNINFPPVADFDFSLACWGDSTVFTDLSSLQGPGQLASWDWDFGDGNVSSLQNPVYTYSLAGTYNVTLTVIDTNNCSSSVTKTVEVFVPPIAFFSAASVCEGSTTNFIDLSIANPLPIVSWTWYFGDGNTSASQYPSHNYASAGAYYVSLTVVNVEGCSDTYSDSVYVYENPVALFEADTVCLGGITGFTDLSLPTTQIISWDWDFGDPASGGNNISILQNPIHTYGVSGSHTVTLTVTDIQGCTNTVQQDIWVEPLPVANFSFLNESCVGEEVLFNDLSIPGNEEIIMWVWDFGDGTTETIYAPANPSVTHIYTSGGVYSVTLTVESARGCIDSQVKSINMVPVPTADFTYVWACEDMQTQFNDNSSFNGGSGIISWWWDFGDPLSGGTNNSFFQNPQHVFTGPGSYNVTMIVWNLEFCTDTIIQTVIVEPKPPVDFYYDPACEAEITQFYTDDAVVNINTVVNYLWDFDDGGFSNLQNPAHLFPGSGTYNVTLTITDTSLCEGSITKVVNVDPPPVAFFDVSEPTCESDSMWFDDLSSTTFGFIQTWIWDFDDGTPPDTIQFPDDPNVYHIYNTTGIFGPTLTVINSQGCTHSYTRIIEIDGKPIANFHWSENACQEEEVQFTDASFPNGLGNIITWNWEFDDPLSGANNNSVLENPIHVFTDGGIFYVRLIVTNFSDCRDTIIKAINVNDAPEVGFYWEEPCEDTLTYFFPDSSIMDPSAVVSWFWEFGDGLNSTAPTPAHTYELSGYYNVTLTIQDTGVCTNSITQEIFIDASPVAYFDVSDILCENSPVYFDDLSSVLNSYIVEWTWDFGDGTDTTIYFPDDPDVSHIYTLDGTYLVTLNVMSEDTCYGSEVAYVVIEPSPIALFNYDAACEGTLTQFWDNSNMGGGSTITNWFWDFGDPASAPNHTSTLQNPVHEFSGLGIYTVTLSVTNVNACTDTMVQLVQVNEGAPVDFWSIDTCHNLLTQFFVELPFTDTAAILVYDWDFGDGGLHSNLMNPTYLYNDPGSYDVTLIIYDTSGCSNAVTHEALVRDNPVALFDYETACTNDSTFFEDISYTVNGDLIVFWEWDFGDPASGANNYSLLQDPAHHFTGSGTYDVKLVITTDQGCLDSVELPVTVFSGPVADFTFNVEFCQSGKVSFQDISTATQTVITEWIWYFEPGSYSYIPDPTHNFQQTNMTYDVHLTVTDANGCESEVMHSVYVPAAFEIEMNNTQACVFDPMDFDVTILAPAGDSIYSYAWNFGDPPSGPFNFSTLAEPTHVFNNGSGYYTVTLNAIDMYGCPVTIYDQIYVDDLPQPGFSYYNTQCDSIVHFTDLSFGNGAQIQSWEWDFGDGSPPELITFPPGNTEHFYENEDTYEVTLTVINNLGCEDFITMEVEREPCVHSEFYVLNSPVCERNNIYFADSSGITSLLEHWYWDFGDGFDTIYYDYNPDIHHYYETAGEYEVMLVVSSMFNNQVISDTATLSVTLHPTPVPEFYVESVCFGETSMFYDSTEHVGFFIDSWLWSFGTGDPADISTSKNPVFYYDTAGVFEVTLTTVNQFGCYDSIKQETSVNYLPIADFEHSLACESDPIHFTDLSDGFDENVVAWDWYFNDPYLSDDRSFIQHPEWIYAENGTYTVQLIVENANGCVDTAYHDVLVNTIPRAGFDLYGNQDNMQGSILLEDYSIGGIEYLWTFGDGYEMWGNIPPITHIYEDEGEFDVSLVIWNEFGCMDTAYSNYGFMFKTLFIPNALNPSSRDPLVQVFKPVGRNLQDFYIAVHDTWGNLLWESTKLDIYGRPVDSWDGTYDGEPLPTDVYIWRASARFRDGTIWEGTVIGNNAGTSGSTSGTVTIVR